jgi:hypothetical protein
MHIFPFIEGDMCIIINKSLIIISMATKLSTVSYEDIEKLGQHKEQLQEAAASAVKVIADAAAQASKLVSDVASQAAKVVSDAAAVSVKVLHEKNQDDHDLLIELKTTMGFLRNDIKDLSSGVTQEITFLKNNKADKIEFDNLEREFHGVREKRLRDVEAKSANYMITMALVMVAIATAYFIVLTHILK